MLDLSGEYVLAYLMLMSVVHVTIVLWKGLKGTRLQMAIKPLVVLSGAAIAAWTCRGLAGTSGAWVGAAVWVGLFVPLTVVPALVATRFVSLARAGRYREAARWSLALRWLMPEVRAMAGEAEVMKAMAEIDADDVASGLSRLDRVIASGATGATVARLTKLRFDGTFEQVERGLAETEAAAIDPVMAASTRIALAGTLGRRDRVLAEYMKARPGAYRKLLQKSRRTLQAMTAMWAGMSDLAARAGRTADGKVENEADLRLTRAIVAWTDPEVRDREPLARAAAEEKGVVGAVARQTYRLLTEADERAAGSYRTPPPLPAHLAITDEAVAQLRRDVEADEAAGLGVVGRTTGTWILMGIMRRHGGRDGQSASGRGPGGHGTTT